jgi:MYXO-CTERM domain-containing protein
MRPTLFALCLVAGLAGRAAADNLCHSRLMIVLDRSCSMNMPPKKGGTQTKWELAGLALQTVTTKYQGMLDFGLIMFPDQTGMNCLQDGPIYVNVAPGNESKVVTTVMSTMPTGPCVTDIKPAVDQVSSDPAFGGLDGGTTGGVGPRSFVLFISDGMQTCGGNANMIAASFQQLYDNGHPSYIVGFGDGVAPAALDQFAMAGGVPRKLGTDGGTPDGGGRLYYQADDAQQLDDALDEIIGAVAAEFSVCPGVPCPDGRCFQAGASCVNGYCQAPEPDGGASTGTSGSSTGSSGSSTSTSGATGGSSGSGGDLGTVNHGRATDGCGCGVGGEGAGSTLFILFAGIALLVIARRSRRSKARDS